MCIVCRLICIFCSNRRKCQADAISDTFEIGDHPILNRSGDVFKVQERIVNKIYQDLNGIHGQIAIAITGEWGIGKTSVMNLLQNKLIEADDKNIIIKFDPQIEGKFEISDLIGAFYLKLYQRIRNKKIKAFLVKSLQALSVLSNVDIKGSIGIPGVVEVGASYNPKKSIDALIKAFERTKPEEFSLQAEEQNKLLKEEKVKLYVIIDEIDRLSEPYITNFLLFCRTLEVFDNLICIIGMDYEQVLNKLMYERAGSQLKTHQIRYSGAKNYVDKLFQIKYQVHHDIYTLTAYVVDQIKRIDSENVLPEVFAPDDYKKQEEFMSLVSYLATPRRIKKWLISLKLNYSLLKYSHANKFDYMAFLAVTVKHPVVTDNLSKNTNMLIKHRGILYIDVNDQFGFSFTEKDNDDILMAGLGVIGVHNKKDKVSDDRKEKLEKLIESLGTQFICDPQSSKYVLNFLNIPTYLILLFIQGVLNPEHASLFSDYFNGKIDAALKTLLEDDPIVNMSAKDLAGILYKGGVGPSDIPTLTAINKLWSQKIDSSDIINYYINYYEIIARISLRKVSIENIIADCPLGLSESYLNEILYVCGVSNKDAKYNLVELRKPEDEVIYKKYLGDAKFEGKLIKDFGGDYKALKAMLTKWLDKFESDFQTSNAEVFCQKSLISIFYRYIQWGQSVDARDNRGKLASYVIAFLQNKNTDEKDKAFLKKSLNNEVAKNSKDGFLGRGNVMQDLFNDRGQEVLSLVT